MDFGFDNLLSAASNNGGFPQETDADLIRRRLYGSGFQKHENNSSRSVDEDGLQRAFKLCKTNTSCPKANNVSENRLPFSSPFPFYNGASDAVSRSAGYGFGGMSMPWSVRGPFSPSQWMELEHQALIYKYINANVPIPSYLLNPIRKALDSSGFSLLRPNALGWGGFHLGFSNTDPEPGRCRRTDGKKWRCSRDAVADQKYCERHINRGRHRSRNPVEGQPGHSTTTKVLPDGGAPPKTAIIDRSAVDKESTTGAHSSFHQMQSSFKESEFGLVNSDSLLNPCSSLVKSTKSENNVIRQFMEVYPKSHSSVSWSDVDRTQLSISIPNENEATRMGLSVGANTNQRQSNWVQISSIGGPLGEALHSTSECKSSSKALNLIENWDHSPRGEGVAMASLGRA